MKVKFDLEPTFNETFTEVFDARMPANSCHEIINNQTFCNNFYGMAVSHDANMVNGCLEVSVRDSNSTTFANMRVGCFSMFYAAGHSYYTKDIVSVHTSEKDEYVSRLNPLQMLTIFFR